MHIQEEGGRQCVWGLVFVLDGSLMEDDLRKRIQMFCWFDLDEGYFYIYKLSGSFRFVCIIFL